METNPFTILARFIVAGFEITMHVLICVYQVIWFSGSGRRDKIGDAVGDLGKGFTEAMVRVFHK